MKKLIGIFILFSFISVLHSCKKYQPLEFNVEKPASVLAQGEIDSLPDLKTLINRQANPGFKLASGVNLSEYNQKGVMYRLVNSNFDEIVAGYEMKHFAVVQNDGSLNLENVKTFLNTAKEAGISVFGHTLTWHANQNATYLNSLIAPTIIKVPTTPTWDIVTAANFETNDASNYQSNANALLSFTVAGQGAGGSGRALQITNSAVRTNDYDAQFFLKFSPAAKVGEQYELSMDVRSDAPASFSTQAHTVPYSYKYWDFFGTISSTTTWSKYTKQITITSNTDGAGTIAFNLGKTATNYYFDNIALKKYNEKGSGSAGYAYTFTNPTATNFWSAQVAYDVPTLANNTEYTLKFAAKGTVAGSIRAELQSTSNYSSNSFGTFALSNQWQEYTLKTTTTAADRNRFVISFGDYAGKVYIDNVSLTPPGGTTSIIPGGDFENGVGNWVGWGNNSTRGLSASGEGYSAGDIIIQKTPLQKDSIISAALEKWIAGMMAVAKPYVNAWDVVNEPMADWPDVTKLKTGVGKTNMAADEFYWQDYLGKDYAVKAIQYARKYGNPDDKLFINDYGLESNTAKCQGLIDYVAYVESKGVKVDGIATQMHMTIGLDKTKIDEMFRLLAATGKLIKISEMDIGVGVKTAQATTEMYQQQADLYKYVIEKYFEIVPAAQRYGVTIWSPLDSPASSSWRGDEPIGLWTRDYIRKLAYKSVAETLKAKAGQ